MYHKPEYSAVLMYLMYEKSLKIQKNSKTNEAVIYDIVHSVIPSIIICLVF